MAEPATIETSLITPLNSSLASPSLSGGGGGGNITSFAKLGIDGAGGTVSSTNAGASPPPATGGTAALAPASLDGMLPDVRSLTMTISAYAGYIVHALDASEKVKREHPGVTPHAWQHSSRVCISPPGRRGAAPLLRPE